MREPRRSSGWSSREPSPASTSTDDAGADLTEPAEPLELLVICTGNAARSVMAGLMLEARAQEAGLGLHLTTAGTHALEGQPASWRTREALEQLAALGASGLRRHRSQQLTEQHLEAADLVVGMETDHVRWVRRRHPAAAARTATLRRLCRDLRPAPPALGERLVRLSLERVELEAWEDVEDPAGHEVDVYAARAEEIWELAGELVRIL